MSIERSPTTCRRQQTLCHAAVRDKARLLGKKAEGEVFALCKTKNGRWPHCQSCQSRPAFGLNRPGRSAGARGTAFASTLCKVDLLSATEGSASEAADVRHHTARLMAEAYRPQPRARFPRKLSLSAAAGRLVLREAGFRGSQSEPAGAAWSSVARKNRSTCVANRSGLASVGSSRQWPRAISSGASNFSFWTR
jgi:hypothetical protein